MACTDEQCGRFFDELDAQYQPPPLGAPQNHSGDAAPIVPLLRSRRDARMRSQDIPFPTGDQIAATRAVSTGLIAVFRQVFPSQQAPDLIDFACVQTCFVKFAYGELRTGTERPHQADSPAREPDGSGFFLFAEFALLAIQIESETSIWQKLFAVFAKATELFLIAYPPIKGLTGEHDRKYRKPAALTDAQRQEYHERYTDLTQEQAEGKYRDTLRRATEQRQVSYVPAMPLDRDGLLASLQYGALLGAVVSAASTASRDGVSTSRDVIRQLLALEPSLGPSQMPRVHGFPGSEDDEDGLRGARHLVEAAIQQASTFLQATKPPARDRDERA